jgi:hypothetical protein
MIGFIGTLVTISLNYNQYSTIGNLHTFQFTVAHALEFSVSTSCLLAMDLNTETITSNHYEVFLPFLVQSPWTADSPELDPIFQFYHQPISSLSSLDFVIICTQLISSQLQTHSHYIDAAWTMKETQHTYCCVAWITQKTLPPYCCVVRVLERV